MTETRTAWCVSVY